jgi:hypothetical protein
LSNNFLPDCSFISRGLILSVLLKTVSDSTTNPVVFVFSTVPLCVAILSLYNTTGIPLTSETDNTQNKNEEIRIKELYIIYHIK